MASCVFGMSPDLNAWRTTFLGEKRPEVSLPGTILGVISLLNGCPALIEPWRLISLLLSFGMRYQTHPMKWATELKP